MSRVPETLLGFDLGEKRIGVAVGQSVTGTASPLCLVRGRAFKPDWSVVDGLVETWRPDALVVGLPLNMDGTEQLLTRRARRFGNQLTARYRLPVHFADERLSSREARDRLSSTDRIGDALDPVAAQVILEGWFADQPAPESSGG